MPSNYKICLSASVDIGWTDLDSVDKSFLSICVLGLLLGGWWIDGSRSVEWDVSFLGRCNNMCMGYDLGIVTGLSATSALRAHVIFFFHSLKSSTRKLSIDLENKSNGKRIGFLFSISIPDQTSPKYGFRNGGGGAVLEEVQWRRRVVEEEGW
nr:hypothetical protein [Tanacetum cinerariifolium]